MFRTNKNILIVRPGGIGDVVLTVPLLIAIHNYFERSKVTLLTIHAGGENGSPVDMLKTLDFSRKNSIYLLCGIFIFSIIIRIYYFDETIPVTMDALHTFYYASDVAIIGKVPENYDIAKPGWSIFLGGIFSFFDF